MVGHLGQGIFTIKPRESQVGIRPLPFRFAERGGSVSERRRSSMNGMGGRSDPEDPAFDGMRVKGRPFQHLSASVLVEEFPKPAEGRPPWISEDHHAHAFIHGSGNQ